MRIFKYLIVVALLVALAVGIFNGAVVLISMYFGPFYEGDADQNRNFWLWLVGNGVVVLGAAAAGSIYAFNGEKRRREIESQEAMEELVRQTQELGMGYDVKGNS